jgi:hypothetical protein
MSPLVMGVRAYLHIHSGRWQWRCDDEWATVELRDAMTHRTLLTMPAALAVAALLHYVGQAELTAAILPAALLPPRPGPTALDTGGQPRLRGAENRRLRGRKRPQDHT